MAVWEVREHEIDWLAERWLYSRVAHSAVIARYAEAEAGEWRNPDFRAENDLIFYHRFLAERLMFYAGRDVSNQDRALGYVNEIAWSSLLFIKRYGWGSDDLNKVARKTVELWGEPEKGGLGSWWERADA